MHRPHRSSPVAPLRIRRVLASGPALLASVFAVACSSADGDRTPDDEGARPVRSFSSTLVEGTPMYDVLPPGAIPAIDRPEFVSAAEADDVLHPDEPVIGVVGRDGTAKAYSAWQLDRHEIVNDQLDGAPIAVTW